MAQDGYIWGPRLDGGLSIESSPHLQGSLCVNVLLADNIASDNIWVQPYCECIVANNPVWVTERVNGQIMEWVRGQVNAFIQFIVIQVRK